MKKTTRYRSNEHGGDIDDIHEGQVFIYEKLGYGRHKETISLDNVFIYCGCGEFFSDSLLFAIKEGRNSCTLITDPIGFSKKISESDDNLIYIGVERCEYVGRELHYDGESNSIACLIKEDNNQAIFVKPKHMASQREIRCAWVDQSDRTIFHKNIDLTNYLIPINYSFTKADEEALLGHRPVRVAIEINYINKEIPDIIIGQKESKFLSSVIIKSGDQYLLAFISPDNKHFGNTVIVPNLVVGKYFLAGILNNGWNILLACPLEWIESINYLSVDDQKYEQIRNSINDNDVK